MRKKKQFKPLLEVMKVVCKIPASDRVDWTIKAIKTLVNTAAIIGVGIPCRIEGTKREKNEYIKEFSKIFITTFSKEIKRIKKKEIP